MAGENELEKDSGRYVQSDYAVDDRKLDELLEAGELPDDMTELESQLGFSSFNKGEFAEDGETGEGSGETDDTASKDDETDQDQAAGETGDKPDTTDTATSDNPEQPATGKQAEKAAGEETGQGGEEASTPDGDDQGAGEETPAKQPDGVLTRDGKHVIPYSVLERTREENQELKRRQEEQAEELERLRTAAQRTEQGSAAAQDQLATAKEKQDATLSRHGIDRDDLPFRPDGTLDVESLKDEYPEEIVNVLSATNQQIAAMTQRLNDMERDREEQAARERALVRESVQDAVDAVPELAEVQAEGGRRWKIATTIDNDLRDDPDWANKPHRLRFVEVTHLLNGGKPRSPEEVEAALTAAEQQPSPSSQTSQPGDPRERADQRLQEAAGGRRAPPTHSDLPAGEKPAQSDMDRLQGMDAVSLEKAFEGAEDPDELINRYLR